MVATMFVWKASTAVPVNDLFNKLTACVVCCDWSDGYQVSFVPREHTVGSRGQFLDDALVCVIEVYTLEHPNSHCQAIYYCNPGYALAVIVDEDDS